MEITLLQTNTIWAQPEVNLEMISQMLNEQSGSDLYVLPEMFSTGFVMEPEGKAESNGLALSWMRREAVRRGCAIAGSVATEEDGRFYNRFFFAKPDGTEVHYDKRHLFSYAGEHRRYTAGERRVLVDYRGVRFLLQVCYDLRFPVFSRNRGDYDVALYVANWPTKRITAWNTLLRARAMENQCYVVGVNRVGQDPAVSYSGGSMAIDPWGETIAECEPGKAGAATATIDLERLAKFRERFPVLRDADPAAESRGW